MSAPLPDNYSDICYNDAHGKTSISIADPSVPRSAPFWRGAHGPAGDRIRVLEHNWRRLLAGAWPIRSCNRLAPTGEPVLPALSFQKKSLNGRAVSRPAGRPIQPPALAGLKSRRWTGRCGASSSMPRIPLKPGGWPAGAPECAVRRERSTNERY